jgi:hypothetical protein
MALTDAAIRNAKPGEKPVKLFDERGLYLEISPNGGKWWRLKYRCEGKEKRLSLGTYPDVGLKDARKLLVGGVDPSAHRKAQKAARATRAANRFRSRGARVAHETFCHVDRVPRRTTPPSP